MKREFTSTVVWALSVCVLSSSAFAQGRIIAIGDEWLLSDTAFTDSPVETEQLAENVARYFTSGGVGSFLAASDSSPVIFGSRGVNGSELAAKMQSLGHSWTIDPAPVISLANLSQYDAVFFSGTVGSGSANSAVLVEYVQNGGSVLVMAGTGDFGSAGAEAGQWNPFLNPFGLSFGGDWFAPGVGALLDVPVVAGSHALNQSLGSITWGNGQLAVDLVPNDPLNAVVVQGDFSSFGNGPQGAINDVIAVYNVPQLPGDYNGNGVVDAPDYTVWRDTLGSTTDPRADGTGPSGVPDGLVDTLDYGLWQSNFGMTIGDLGAASLATNVPEPAALLLAELSVVSLPFWRRTWRAPRGPHGLRCLSMKSR